MSKSKNTILLITIPTIIIAVVLYLIPSINERVNNRLDLWRVSIRYALFPPESAVFVPNSNVSDIVQATVLAMTPSATPQPSITPTPRTTYFEAATPTPTITPTGIPAQFSFGGVKYVDQHGATNYCAPATLAMELSYWGWKGTREDIGKVVKPFNDDYNVMPYELADYVSANTGLSVMVRSGGDLEILKKLAAANFPVMVEKGAYMVDRTGVNSWMGHYGVITGYDDQKQQFVTQDSYYQPDLMVKYSDLEQQWRSFNNVFLIVYTPEKEAELKSILGPLAEEESAYQVAYQRASDETNSLTGVDQYFAWFNRGTSQVNLQDFAGAAASYDEAFRLYETLPKDRRPWRMLWYQTGPYFAYFYSGRYQDVVDLATLTITNAGKPYFEESLYWRAKANLVIGQRDQAITDLKDSLKYHPGFNPSLTELSAQGVAP
jgi:uncharacterized protein YvpB